MEEFDFRVPSAKPVEQSGRGADDGYSIARFYDLVEQAGGEIATGDERKVDTADARQQPKDPAVAQAQASFLVQALQVGIAMKANHMIHIGGDDVSVGLARLCTAEPILHLIEGQPVEVNV